MQLAKLHGSEVSPIPDEESSVEAGMRVWTADLVFELEQGLRVGYRGFYACEA